MEFLIRFSQSHETFRMPEIQALAVVAGVDMKVVYYDVEVSTLPATARLSLHSVPDQRP